MDNKYGLKIIILPISSGLFIEIISKNIKYIFGKIQ
jgi:hypothetical protein